MELSDFDYNLPKELIAQYPLRERERARLMVIDRLEGTIKHSIFKEIPNYLGKDDLLVLNDTRVLPARIAGNRLTGGRVQLLLLKRKCALTFEAMIKPAKVRLSEKIIFNGGEISARISAKNEVVFDAQDEESVYKLGTMPLPPYIKRKPEESDNIYYQTVYADKDGAVASPTAGLHFSADLISALKPNLAFITLHVGPGTFRPVKTADIRNHKMEAEYFNIPVATANAIKRPRKNKGKIFAVGTTCLRALEAYAAGGIKEGYTDLFIYPGYKFNLADALLTNFHLPRTTLFMLVCAFMGQRLAKKAYQVAIEERYRFYSYGDAMLIL